jgi:uncharacterized protein involved in exopolysaccharide biosynthesis
MSSPLDGRIRAAARAELETLLGGAPSAPDDGGADRVTALEQAVATLTDSVGRLEARLNTLEKTAGPAEQDGRTSVRRTRKPASE